MGEVFLGKVLEEFGAPGGSAVPRPRGAWPVTKGAWSIVEGAWLYSLAPPLAVRSGVRRAPGAERDERGLREGRGGALRGHGGARRARRAAAHQKDYPRHRRAEPALQGAGGERNRGWRGGEN